MAHRTRDEIAMECISRRSALAGMASLAATSFLATPSLAGSRDPRLMVVLMRGALDGLALAAPVGDPNYAQARGGNVFGEGDVPSGLPLDGLFHLNPNLRRLHALYGRGEASLVHAVATPYRGRSHFEGQDVLESGMGGVGTVTSGWLNRIAGALGDREKGVSNRRLVVAGPTVPVILSGPVPVSSWIPPQISETGADTRERLLQLYAASDPEMARVLSVGLDAIDARIDDAARGRTELRGRYGRAGRPMSPRQRAVLYARSLGRMMARPDGPRLSVLDLDGFDTHAAQHPVKGRLGALLTTLDDVVGAVEEALRPVWRDSVIVFVTEFGRTVAINGTRGTDHGSGTAAILAGGAVRGGRVHADWPGLGERTLHEGRDLRATTDLRAVLKGIARDHLGVSSAALDTTIFPGSSALRPVDALVV